MAHSEILRRCTVVIGIGALLTCANSAPSLATSSRPSLSMSYLYRLNAERVEHGLVPLRLRPDLCSAAHDWAMRMAAADRLQHNPGLEGIASDWQSIGENVGVGATITDLDQAFLASAPHRANILDPGYRYVGIGSVRGDNRIWITVDFLRPFSTQPAPQQSRPARQSTPSRPSAATQPTLSLGSVGAAVARVQLMLHVAVDGMFGPVTRSAVVNFQRRLGLVPDGIVGRHTWAALLAHRLAVPG